MNFTDDDLKNLLLSISKQSDMLELLCKGWTDFSTNKLKYNNAKNVSSILEEGENMRNITKRKDNRYMIRKVINGVRVTKYARSFTEAKTILRKLTKQSNPTEEIKRYYTFKEYAEYYLETFKKPFLTTRSYYEVNRFVARITKQFGNRFLQDISTDQIQKFFNGMQAGRSKEKTFIYFNSIMQKAVDTQKLSYNPCNAVIKDKKVKSKNDSYTFDEQVKILNAIKGSNIEKEIYIYLMTGCRPNELPKKENFDFVNNVINIYGTKNDNALHRTIEMSQEFSNYIEEELNKKDIQAELYISRKFSATCKSIGISKPLLYRLRHTFATNHFTLGTQPKIVQTWLGHSSISMTLDTYTDLDKTATKDKILALYNNFYYIKN